MNTKECSAQGAAEALVAHHAVPHGLDQEDPPWSEGWGEYGSGAVMGFLFPLHTMVFIMNERKSTVVQKSMCFTKVEESILQCRNTLEYRIFPDYKAHLKAYNFPKNYSVP